MTESSKISRRGYLQTVGAAVVGLAVGAAGGYFSAQGGPTPSTATQTVTSTVTQAVTGAMGTEIPNPFTIASVNAGPAGTQWGSAVLRGMDAAVPILAKEFPDQKLKFLEAWSVKPTDKPSVYDGFISEGANVIWDSDFTQTLDKPLIEANPKVVFLEGAYTLADSPNAAIFEWDVQIGGLLQGIIAGTMTKKNKVGLVAPFKDVYDALTFNCYRQGAKLVNPNAECYYVFTGDYHDVSLGMKAATALIAAGCDFIVGEGNGMTTGAIKGAQAAHVYSMGVYADQYDVAPDTVVASTLWNSGILISDVCRMIWKGNWPRAYYPSNPDFLPHPHFRYDLKDNTVALTPFNPAIPVPDIVNQTIDKCRADNAAGKFALTTDTTWPTALEVS